MGQSSSASLKRMGINGLPNTYDEWRARAIEKDRGDGADLWKTADESPHYDYRFVRRQLQQLRIAIASGDPALLLSHLNDGVHGNFGGIGAAALYRRARYGTKNLIAHYVVETSAAIELLLGYPDDQISVVQKQEFLRQTQACFGRSALMLSGAGSLGPFHLGVVSVLVEQDLLPDVLSGASAGALVAALIGTHPFGELSTVLSPMRLADALANTTAVRGQARLEVDDVRALIAAQIPDLTFAEAFEISGRYINISVAPSEPRQRSRMLNALTTPQALVREAVLASCAIPGVFPPVRLMARDDRGIRKPFMPLRQWIDGSVTDDLPSKRLARLYGVNHFIASQTNPIVLWAMQDVQFENGWLHQLSELQRALARQWFVSTYSTAMRLTKSVHPLNLLVRRGYGIATQEYAADITILPRKRWWRPDKLLAPLGSDEVLRLLQDGQAATWPKVERIRNAVMIGRTISRLAHHWA